MRIKGEKKMIFHYYQVKIASRLSFTRYFLPHPLLKLALSIAGLRVYFYAREVLKRQPPMVWNRQLSTLSSGTKDFHIKDLSVKIFTEWTSDILLFDTNLEKEVAHLPN